MNVCFVAAGPITWGSSRMRAYWVADKMPGAVCVQHGGELPPADTYIWQKSFDLEFIKRQSGAHYWDACDPAWWFSPNEVADVIPRLDGIVCSTKALADDLRKWYTDKLPPVHVIPDRLDLAHFPIKQRAKPGNVIRFIWFGIAVNRVALHGALINLARLRANGINVDLTIMDDRPDIHLGKFDFPIYYIRWSLDMENQVISNHDIALLPPYPGSWGEVKSNNKSVTAWACGVPTADGLKYDMLTAIIKQARAGNLYIPDVSEKYDVSLSAREWEAIVCPS